MSMRNAEKIERLKIAYTDVCRVKNRLENGLPVGDFPLLDAVANLQILLTDGFGEDWTELGKIIRTAGLSKANPKKVD